MSKFHHLSAFRLASFTALAAGIVTAQADGTSALAESIRAHPVTDEILRQPAADDWLMYSRTYDAQRFSPLEQINADNVGDLEKVWSKPLPPGVIEVIPIV